MIYFMDNKNIIGPDELILITGSNGFIGSRVVETFLCHGYTNLRCFTRPSSNLSRLNSIISAYPSAKIDVINGNLLSVKDSNRAAAGASIICHLAAGIEKTFPGSFLNSVITTRNLLEAVARSKCIKRFVNISSFAVYSNIHAKSNSLFDETCALEDNFTARNEAYCTLKLSRMILS